MCSEQCPANVESVVECTFIVRVGQVKNMEICSFEMFGTTWTQCWIPEYLNLQQHQCEDLVVIGKCQGVSGL